jgi:hypothetical protein
MTVYRRDPRVRDSNDARPVIQAGDGRLIADGLVSLSDGVLRTTKAARPSIR